MAQGDAGREHVRRGQQRQAGFAHVPRGHAQGRDQTAIEDPAGAQRGKCEDLAGMRGVVVEIHQEQHHLGAHQRSQAAIHAQVDGGVEVETRAAGQAPGEPQGRHEGHGHQHAVGVEKRKMKDLRVHLPPAVWAGATSSSSSPLPITMAESATLKVGHW